MAEDAGDLGVKCRGSRSKAQFRVHAPVKHADDGQLGFRFAVENDVLSDRMGAQPFVDIIAPGFSGSEIDYE